MNSYPAKATTKLPPVHFPQWIQVIFLARRSPVIWECGQCEFICSKGMIYAVTCRERRVSQLFWKCTFHTKLKTTVFTDSHTHWGGWGSFLTGNELMRSECLPVVNAFLCLSHNYSPFFSHFLSPSPLHTYRFSSACANSFICSIYRE